MERLYRASYPGTDIHMQLTGTGETVDDCDKDARGQLARDSHPILSRAMWKLERQEWVSVDPAYDNPPPAPES